MARERPSLDFLGIGGQKCATTWLYHWLAGHPEIAMPRPKELQFWDNHYDRGLAWYRDIFAALPEDKKRGEISPDYAILPPDRIREIRRHYPALRLIFIARDPVERAWSAALMDLKDSGRTPADVPHQWYVANFLSRRSRARGDYETCLRNWLSAYPPESLLLLRYESVRDEPRLLLKRCAEHIGVDPDFYDRVPEERFRKKWNEGSGALPSPLLAATLESLYHDQWRRFQRFAKEPACAPKRTAAR